MQLRLACVQCTGTLSQHENLQLLDPLIREAAGAGAELISLPEAANVMSSDRQTGEYYAEADDPCVIGIQKLAKSLRVWIHFGSALLLPYQKKTAADESPKLYNRTLMIDSDGKIVTRYDKKHLFWLRYGALGMDEGQQIQAGNRLVCADTPWGMIGLSICYDLRYSTHYHRLREMGATMLAVPAAFTRVTGKAHWHSLLRARAIENACFVFAANQGGKHQDGRTTYGHSLIIDPWGEILAEYKGESSGFIIATLDSKAIEKARSSLNAWATQ